MTEIEFFAEFGEQFSQVFKTCKGIKREKYIEHCYKLVSKYPVEDIFAKYFDCLLLNASKLIINSEDYLEKRDVKLEESTIDFQGLGISTLEGKLIAFGFVDALEVAVKQVSVNYN